MTTKRKVVRKENVRPWVHKIFGAARRCRPCCPVLPTDGAKLEALIQEHGELVVMYAWYVFVDDGEGTMWHADPVVHVDEFTSKKGNKILREIEDTSSRTSWPLASFLKCPDGPLFAAKEALAKPDWRKDLWPKDLAAIFS